MKISEIIKVLQEAMDKHGDLNCLSSDEGGIYLTGKAKVTHDYTKNMYFDKDKTSFVGENSTPEEIGEEVLFLHM